MKSLIHKTQDYFLIKKKLDSFKLDINLVLELHYLLKRFFLYALELKSSNFINEKISNQNFNANIRIVYTMKKQKSFRQRITLADILCLIRKF